MILEGTIHCEAPECEIHQHVGADTMAAKRLPAGWVQLLEFGSNGNEQPVAFCGLNCALKWLGRFPPPQRFTLGDDGELHRDVDDAGEQDGSA